MKHFFVSIGRGFAKLGKIIWGWMKKFGRWIGRSWLKGWATVKEWFRAFLFNRMKYNWVELIVNWVILCGIALLLAIEIPCLIIFRERILFILEGLIGWSAMFPYEVMITLACLGVVELIVIPAKIVLMLKRKRDGKKKDIGGPVSEKIKDITKYKPIDQDVERKFR
ncbi:MAG: hypothetical protein LBT17_01125 [Mycoplasmataceae bacterium]|nr:hypothetical protein [Mycoplasmataceae bacterium]